MLHAEHMNPPNEKPGFHPDPRLYRVMSRDDLPFDAADGLLRAHADMMQGRMVASGGPDFDGKLHIDSFWNKFDEVLPPSGSFYLAKGRDDDWLGTGALRTIAPGTGEMKHMYVRAEMRRRGLGRALVEARMSDARAMGLTTLLADTLRVNHEMLGLYNSLGFRRVAPHDASGTAALSPELVGRMAFLRLDF